MSVISKSLFLWFFFVSVSLAEGGPRAWLIGHWKSNKEMTVPTLRFAKPLTPEKRARFDSILGRYEICFVATEGAYHMTAFEKYPPYSGAFNYRVLVETKDRLILKCVDDRTGKEDVGKIRFEGHDRCWVEVDTIKGVTGSQCFDRVYSPMPPPEPNQPPEPTSGLAPGCGSS